MLGKVGSLQNIPAPSASTLNEALKLLSTFGDSKSISKLLEQVKEVQESNEHVFREAQAALSALKTTQDSLYESQKEFSNHVALENSSLRRRAEELSQAEAKLSGLKIKFDHDKAAAEANFADTRESLAIAEQAVSKRELACSYKEQSIIQKQSELDALQKSIDQRAQQLRDKESKLRIALGVE